MMRIGFCNLLIGFILCQSQVYAHQQQVIQPVEVATFPQKTGLWVSAECANITVRSVSSNAPMKLYSNYPDHWEIKDTCASQVKYFLHSNGALFLRTSNGIFLCEGNQLFALPSTADNELKKTWTKSQFVGLGDNLLRDGKPFTKVTPTDLKLQTTQPEQVLIDLPKGRTGTFNFWAGRDTQLQMPGWQGSEVVI
jgi:hypothetical protein